MQPAQPGYVNLEPSNPMGFNPPKRIQISFCYFFVRPKKVPGKAPPAGNTYTASLPCRNIVVPRSGFLTAPPFGHPASTRRGGKEARRVAEAANAAVAPGTSTGAAVCCPGASMGAAACCPEALRRTRIASGKPFSDAQTLLRFSLR